MSLTATTTTTAVPANVDLRRQSIRHFSGMIKCNPQETERITDAVILGILSFIIILFLIEIFSFV